MRTDLVDMSWTLDKEKMIPLPTNTGDYTCQGYNFHGTSLDWIGLYVLLIGWC